MVDFDSKSATSTWEYVRIGFYPKMQENVKKKDIWATQHRVKRQIKYNSRGSELVGNKIFIIFF